MSCKQFVILVSNYSNTQPPLLMRCGSIQPACLLPNEESLKGSKFSTNGEQMEVMESWFAEQDENVFLSSICVAGSL